MLPLDDVVDYREYLKHFYAEQKKSLPLYSYREMGKKLGLDASQLYRIIYKNEHLPTRCVPLAKDLMGLSGRAGTYFETIVAAARSRSPAKKKELLNKAFSLRDVRRQVVATNELRFFSEWWIPVVYSYLEVTGGRASPEEIASSITPPVSKQQVMEALEVLKTLGFVKRLSSERLSLSQTHLTIQGPEKAKAVRTFQKEVMNLAIDALDNISVDLRDISTLTVAVDEECFADIRGMMLEYRRQIQKRVEETTSPDRIMELSLALFPLAVPE